ncbi:MAG TPA: phage tail tape measure protein [Bacilli bacterium]|nr:phage tail tape measure protein [Bacilli bacterium]
MASVRDITARLILNSRQWRSEIDRAQRDLTQLRGDFGLLEKGGTAAMLAIAASVAKFVNESKKFEAALKNFQVVTKATQAQMEAFADAANRASATYGRSSTEIVTAATNYVKAGGSIEAALNGGIEAVTALSAATSESADISAELLSAIGNVYPEMAAKIKDSANLVTNAVNLSATDLRGFQLAFGNAASVAAAEGMKIEDLSAAIGVLTNAGQQASDAGTGFRVFLNNLIPSTKENIELFKEFGLITADNSNVFMTQEGHLKSLAQIVAILQDKFSGLTAEARVGVFKQMFGDDAQRAAAIFFDKGAKAVSDFKAQLQDTTAAEIAQGQLDTLQGSLDKLGVQVDNASKMLGDEFAPAVRMVADGIAALLGDFQSMNENTKHLLTSGATMTATFVGLTLVLRGLQKAAKLTAATYGMGGLSGAFAGVARWLGPVGLALSLGTSLYVAYRQEAARVDAEVRKVAEAHRELSAELAKNPLQRTAADVDSLQGRADELKTLVATYEEALSKYEDLQKRIQYAKSDAGQLAGKSVTDEIGGGLAKALGEDKLTEYSKALYDAKEALKEFGVEPERARQTLESLNAEVKKSVFAQYESIQADAQKAIADKVKIDRAEELIKRYGELTGTQSRNAESTAELRQVADELRQMYPSLIVQIDAEGKANIQNLGIAQERVTAEKSLLTTLQDSVSKRMEAMLAETKASKSATEAIIRDNVARANSYKRAMEAAQIGNGKDLSVENEILLHKGMNVDKMLENASEKQEEVNRLTGLIGQMEDDLARMANGDYSINAPNLSGGVEYDPYDTGGDKKAKGKSAADLAQEAYNAEREAVEKAAAFAQRAYDQGEIDDAAYVQRLQAIQREHTAFLANEYQTRWDIQDRIRAAQHQAQSDDFASSESWITAETKRMRGTGESSIEVAKAVYDAWNRVASRKGRYTTEDEARATEELANAKRNLLSVMQQEYRAALEFERTQDIDRLRDRQKAEQDAIRAKLDALDAEAARQDYLRQIEQERAKLGELEADRAKVAADKRFEIIERDASGNLVKRRVADLAKLNQIDQQVKDEKARIAEMEEQERRRRLRAQYEADLADLRAQQDREMAAREAFWKARLDEEQVTADLAQEIQKNGMEKALEQVHSYTSEMVAEYKRAQAEIMAAGNLSLPSAGTIGGGVNSGSSSSKPSSTSPVLGGVTGSILDVISKVVNHGTLAQLNAVMTDTLGRGLVGNSVSNSLTNVYNSATTSKSSTTDNSTHIHGPIHVKADNVNELLDSIRRVR